ncbi:MAG: glycosyltransferase family 2 protein, partial [Lachnospiraceae bacterium]|nr:glycosyltransferase family 2 protein [Lachnospiraceae bacterium]
MINKILKPSNWKKTYYYIKKNGFKAAVMAALERLQKSENDSYQYVPPTEEELTKQRELSSNGEILFSILVPVYRTPEKYFREMIQS